MATRRERVLLEMEDNFSAGMARASAATALLDRQLNSLSGSSVRTSRDSDKFAQSTRKVGDEVARTSSQLRDGQRDLDRYSGRLGLLLKSAAVLGPALVPIGGVAIPALAGLTAGLGAAAGAVGVALIAFNGLGDALKAIDAAQIEPTTANLEKMRAELDKLGPAGADFARYLDGLDPTLRDLQNLTRSGLFPGVEKGIDALLTRLPEVRRFLFDISTEMGNLSASAGKALAGDKFDAFFNYLESDGVKTLREFAQATGNVAEGLVNMLAAFAPASRDFTGGLVGMTAAFADWSAGLSESQGFREFLDYLDQTGPKVADLVGQLAMSFASIVEAAAPVGATLLPALTAVAKVVETIANSDLGTPIFAGLAAMSALRLATQAWANVSKTSVAGFVAGQGRAAASIMQVTSAQDRARMSAGQLAAVEQQRTKATLSSMGRMAGVAAGLAIASTGAADGLGLSNTAMLGLTGTMLGPWGAAGGAALGLTMDIAAANNDLEASIRRVDAAISSGAGVMELQAELEGLDAQITKTNETFSNFHPFSIDLSSPFKSMADNAKGWVAGVNELVTGTEDLAEAKHNEAEAAIIAKGAEERHAAAMNLTSRIARQNRTEIDGLVAAMEEQTSAALGAFDAVTRYGQALDDARAAAAKGKRGIDENTEAGRENRQALSQLAGAWNNQSDAVRNNVEKYKSARAQFIAVATAMTGNREKAKALADALMEIPRSVVTKIEADNDPALRAIRAVKAEMATLKDKTVRLTYYVNQVNAANVHLGGGRDGDPSTPQAGGGFVPKTGRPYADRHHYLLADGEGITTNRRGETDRFRDVISGINLGFSRSQIKGMLADGGFAGSTYARTRNPDGSSLFGIGTAAQFASDSLTRFGNMTEKQLGRQQSLAEKALSQAKERLDEERAALKDLRDARKQFMQDVTSNFRSDIFGGTDLEQAARQGLLGGDFMQSLLTWLRDNNVDLSGGGNVSDYAGQYLATLTPQQIAALQAQASLGTLQQNSQDANAFTQVLQQLQDMGLTGGAFNELAASGNLSQAQAYLAMGPDFLKSLMQEFRGRNQDLKNLGQYVGNVRFGADIREQLQETRRAVRIAQESRDELREVKQAIHHLQQIEQARSNRDKDAPERTGKAVAGAINGGAAATQRRP